jgi:chaperonin cofactor prefoldin|tara:strand:+ start:291 stop:458 length:168 start_codon:yes stop_codon:yes gene_type:complete
MKENYISAVDEVVDLKAKIELLDYQIRSYDRSERLAWNRVHELEEELNERNTINN